MKDIKELDGTEEVTHNLDRDYMKTPDALMQAMTKPAFSAGDALKQVKNYCRENPGKAVGLALGVGGIAGLVLAKIIGRRPSTTERIISNLLRTGEQTWNRMKSGIKPAVRNIKETIGE